MRLDPIIPRFEGRRPNAATDPVPFAYSSNGDAFLEHDRTAATGTVTREIALDKFPSPDELWSRYRASKGFSPEQESIAVQPYYDDGSGKSPRYYQQIAVSVEVFVATERVQYLDSSGRLITESLKDYSRNMVLTEYQSLGGFLSAWNDADRKQAIIEELASKGVFLDELADQVGRDYDAFDLICHIAFDRPPLTRHERANNVKKRDVLTKYGDKARQVLEALLDKYADSGLRQAVRHS